MFTVKLTRFRRLFDSRWPLKISNESWLCISLGIVGLMLVFVVPPYQSPDEQTHLYRAYAISEGKIVSHQLSYGAGGVLPQSLSQSFDTFRPLLFDPERKTSASVIGQALHQPLEPSVRTETRFENTAIYPPGSYLPQIIGIWFGRAVGASPVAILYLARVASLLAWIGSIYHLMKRYPGYKLPLFAFASLPIVAFQSASASADAFTIAITLAVTLAVARALQARSFTDRDQKYLLVYGFVLALCKFPYSLVLSAALFIPNRKFASRKDAWVFRSLIAGLGVLALVWLIVATSGFVNLKAGVDTAAQVRFIADEPLSFLKVLWHTYVTTESDLLYLQMFGVLGWLDTKNPLWALASSYASLLIALLFGARAIFALPRLFKLLLAGVWGGLIALISLMLYLTWNVPGSPIIEGLQGRYFLPSFGFLLVIAGGAFSRTEAAAADYKRMGRVVYCLSGASLACVLIVLIARYYST